MTYEEFEWHILRLAYEEGVDRLQPAFLAYALGMPHDRVNEFLERGTQAGVLEMDVTEDGRLEYFVPGVDRSESLPRPLWKDEFAAEESEEQEPVHENGMDGTLSGSATPTSGPSEASRPKVDTSRIPSSLRAHIENRYPGADGAVHGQRGPYYVESEGTITDEGSTALIPANDDGDFLPARVESNEEAFCDPSRTMFMRQIRIYGDQSPSVIRQQIARLFQSFGYRVVDSHQDRMRFERGSVMFILALVPLFVLVLPLFVYLFLYVMGRSTIQQEPLELDVQFRQKRGHEPFWEIDLTFVGLHGVVLGAADQQVLNREIDTLREELRWALSS